MIYIIIPLIQHPPEMTVARLLNSTKILQSLYSYCSLGFTTYQRTFHQDSSFICWFRVIRVPFSISGVSSLSTRDAEKPGDCGSGVFMAEEVDGVKDKGHIVRYHND
jgi:hypothetical protein